MSLVGVGLAGALMGAKAAQQLLEKRVFSDDMSNLSPIALVWLVGLFATPFLIASVFIVGFPAIEIGYWTALVVNAPLAVVISVSYLRAINVSDVSFVTPFTALTPVLILPTGALILGQLPPIWGVIGLVVVVGGVFILTFDSVTDARGVSDWLRASYTRVRDDGSMKYIAAILIAGALSAPVDLVGVEASSSTFWSLSMTLSIVVLLTPVMWWRGDDGRTALTEWRRAVPIGVLSASALILQMVAILYIPVAYVIAIKRSNILLTVIGGSIFFDEDGLQYRLLGSLLILLGTVLITFTVAYV